MLHLQQKNRDGDSLLYYLLRCREPTVNYIIQMYVCQLTNIEDDTFVEAAWYGRAYLIEKLIDIERGLMARSGDRAFLAAAGCPWRTRCERTIHLLLERGANIFATMASDDSGPYSRGSSAMHIAAERSEYRLLCESLIHHVMELEGKGLQGSVQRCLRMRNDEGETPIDLGEVEVADYLKAQLTAAVSRDGKIMYEMDSDDILEAKSRYDKACHDSEISEDSGDDESPVEEDLAVNLRELVEHRPQKIDLEYKARENDIKTNSARTTTVEIKKYGSRR